MAKSLGSLVIDLALNTARVDKGITSTNKKLDNFANKTRSVARLAAGAFAGFSVVSLGKDLVDIVDKYTLMEGRLKLVQKAGENLADTQEKLFQVAQKTRTETGAVVDFYTQLARATKNLDVAQSDLLQVTESINKAITISGASSASAGAALFQLQQGLAAGALRGQELNSVLEQTPRIAEAIADGLGVTIGELRKLGEQGKLNAETVIKAIQSQAETLDKEFSSVPKTVAQNMQLLTNEFEKAAKNAGGLNFVLNEGIDVLRTWLKIYNQTFGASTSDKLQSLTTKLFGLTEQLKNVGADTRAAKIIRERIDNIKEEISALNDLAFAEYKAQEARSKQTTTTATAKVTVDDSAIKEQQRKAQEALDEWLTQSNMFYDARIAANEEYYNEWIAQDKGFSSAKTAANQEYYDEWLAQENAFQNARNALIAEKAREQDRIERNRQQSLLSSTASIFGSLSAIIGQGSKKQFEISKQLARAETIVSTYAAAQQAYAWTVKVAGPVAAGAAAAEAITAGLARLAAINRTTFNSSSAAGAATGAGQFVAAPSPGPITPGTNAAQGQTFIIISGGETITEQQLDDILSRASQRINEGSQVIIRRDSVQAAELASAVA